MSKIDHTCTTIQVFLLSLTVHEKIAGGLSDKVSSFVAIQYTIVLCFHVMFRLHSRDYVLNIIHGHVSLQYAYI